MMGEGIRDGGEREGGREGEREMHIPAVLRWPDCKMRISYQPLLLMFEDKKVVNDLIFTHTQTQDTLSLAPSVSNEGAVILL